VSEKLTRLPRMRWVADPSSYAPLDTCACGGTSDPELDVEGHLDELREIGPDTYKTRVAEARDSGEIIGVSVLDQRKLADEEPFLSAAYLALSLINQPYRGMRMPDGVTRIGTFLLCDTLLQIEEMWGPPMPMVWSLVHQENRACRNVLARHDFWPVRGKPRTDEKPYVLYTREQGLSATHGFSQHIVDMVRNAAID